jgi:hypothetical protein
MKEKFCRRSSLYAAGITLVLVLAVTLVGQPSAMSAQGMLQSTVPAISGNIGDLAIEIDDLDDNPNTTPDANMTTGGVTDDMCSATVITGEEDSHCPYIDTASGYIDWNDLAPADPGEHVFQDGSGSEDDSFAGTSTRSCLQPAHAAPQKEDILRVYMADNGEYLYIGLVDLAPTGDSRHVILFHKNPVQLGEKCAGDGQQMRLQLTADDKLIRATFKPSADEPTSQVYSIVADTLDPMYMDEAANYSNTALWEPTAEVASFAVNLADLTDDLGGGVSVPAETFGEAAVALSDLNVSPCGTYYVSIITRSSGSGGGESKDYVGGIYQFPPIYVTGSLTPSCEEQFGYTAQAYYDDQFTLPIPTGVSYDWTCDGGVDPQGQSGTQPADPGTYNCTVTATLTDAPTCTATSAPLSVEVFGPISVYLEPSTLDLECPDIDAVGTGVTYTAYPSGGDGNYSYIWTVGGDNVAATCGDADSCPVDFAADDFCGLIDVQVRVNDGTDLCDAVDSEIESVEKVTAVSATDGP